MTCLFVGGRKSSIYYFNRIPASLEDCRMLGRGSPLFNSRGQEKKSNISVIFFRRNVSIIHAYSCFHGSASWLPVCLKIEQDHFGNIEHYVTLTWRHGIVVIASAYVQNRRFRVRIPPGCKVFRHLGIHCSAAVIT
jgi:hypothetical protein